MEVHLKSRPAILSVLHRPDITANMSISVAGRSSATQGVASKIAAMANSGRQRRIVMLG